MMNKWLIIIKERWISPTELLGDLLYKWETQGWSSESADAKIVFKKRIFINAHHVCLFFLLSFDSSFWFYLFINVFNKRNHRIQCVKIYYFIKHWMKCLMIASLSLRLMLCVWLLLRCKYELTLLLTLLFIIIFLFVPFY